MQEDIFTSNGGKFITPPASLKDKLMHVKALLFDWDGVFNSSEKGKIPSSFTEVDSMGINMLRFGYYMLTGQMPYIAIVTGETNQTAFNWAKREKLDNVFFQVKNKVDLLQYLKQHHDINADEILFAFDDILDLSLAEMAGARFLINRKANPLFSAHCVKNSLCDYITFSSGDQHAIREISEVVLDAIGKFEETIRERIAFHGVYRQFLEIKMSKTTAYLRSEDGSFILKQLEDIL